MAFAAIGAKIGDAAIGATVQVVLERVLSLATDSTGQALGFKEEFQRLSKIAKTIRGFVADADDRKHSPGVLDWLKDLEGEAFKAENVLDKLNYEYLRREVEDRSQRKRKLSSFLPSFGTISFRWTMASKIKEINTNLERINQDAIKFGLVYKCQIEAALQVRAPVGAVTSRQTDSVVVPNVVGRANDESKIVEMLLSLSDKVVSVIPIVGMGGLGKTTLAKSVYNRPEISRHFGEKIWVCVAEKIDTLQLFKFILESLTREKVEVYRRDTIIQKIQEKVGGKRYFLVLDDVWNDEQGLWDDFFTTLEGLNTTKGSCCLATTRLEPVAHTMSRHLKMNVGPYKLGKLSDDECWSILTGKVVAGEAVPNELEAIKMQILGRCGGLPLSAKLIGGLLVNKRKEEWQFIVEESLLNLDQYDVKQIIKISFDRLPSTSVKSCFAYCSLFPQDTRLNTDLLIELWMAEGFLQPDSKNESLMEAIGGNCFRILLQSSLLEKVNEWGKTCYKMHDLVHDCAKSALNEDRYLAVNSSQGTVDIINEKTALRRTLFLKSNISSDELSKFKCLHVLKLSGEDIKILPTSVGELIHLRLLDISYSAITILPESLCKLYHLQTLRIQNGKLEEGLPKQMSNLISLRHLHYYDTHAEFQMPSEMGRLTHLQTLQFFNVGQEDGRGIEELGNLKDLKVSLEIRNLELVNGKEGAKGAKLFEKPNLSKLKFLWSSEDRESDNHDEDVLEGLQPHPNLQKLKIRNFMGDQFPGWVLNWSTLVKLEFTNCKRCRELPTLGQLSSLESLKLSGLENIRSIGFSFYGVSGGSGQVRKCFPCLKYLCLEDMENLEEWKDEDEVRSTTGAVEVNLFPVLVRLVVRRCSRLISAPRHFPSIEKIYIEHNCPVWLLKRNVRNITTLSSLKLSGDTVTDSHNDEHVESMSLEKRRHMNNSEGNVEYHLDLGGCGSVPGEMLEHLCHFSSIRSLELSNFSDLTRLMGQESLVFTSLQRLKISECNGFTTLPGRMLESCASLQRLEITKCNGFTTLPGRMLESCASLEELVIAYCDGLTSLPGEMLKSCASLWKLEVRDCPNLVYFPHNLRQTPSLVILNLSDCPKLMIADMPKGFAFLTSLRTLVIGPFSINETNEEFDWLALTSSSSFTLTFLWFCGLPHVESLPEQLQYFTSLPNLRLEDFGMEALPDWIGNLASLEQLYLKNCRNLRCLPSVAVRRHLTKLTYLLILDCPLLEERYKGDTNSEWPIRWLS